MACIFAAGCNANINLAKNAYIRWKSFIHDYWIILIRFRSVNTGQTKITQHNNGLLREMWEQGVALMPHLMRCAYASRLSNLRLESNISFRKNIAAAGHPLSAGSNFQLKGFHGFYSADIFFQ